jgi:tetratricopeptide (TPR) repeat protein
MKVMRALFIFLVLVIARSLPAQNPVVRAMDQYKVGNLQDARESIESALSDSSFAGEVNTWYLKGFIYKDLYKSDPAADSTFGLRLESVKAFEHLLGMKNSERYHGDALQNIRFVATTFYNDAIKLLDRLAFEPSKITFDEFVRTLKLSRDTTISVRSREIEYYMAVAAKKTELHKQDTTHETAYFESAIGAFEHVLALDSTNIKASYNLAVLFYNEAVNTINRLDYDAVDIFAFNEIEDKSIDYFKQSLPYMTRTFELDPNNPNAIEGLAGIYFGLRDFEKSNYYKDLLKGHQTDPVKK